MVAVREIEQSMMKKRTCSCRTVSSRVTAPSAAPRISTATAASPAAAPMPHGPGQPGLGVSGHAPVMRDSEHYFVSLAGSKRAAGMDECGAMQDEVVNKLEEWFDDGLRDWDISRDAPYFGFRIPGHRRQVFLRLGRCADRLHGQFQRSVQRKGLDFDDLAETGDTETLSLHRQGHHLFPLPVLAGDADGRRLPTPTAVYAHGFLTVNGNKMSKSRGTFIMASTYLDHLHPDYLRYYFAAKLGRHSWIST